MKKKKDGADVAGNAENQQQATGKSKPAKVKTQNSLITDGANPIQMAKAGSPKRKVPKDGVYLTKRLLVSRATRAFKMAAKESMEHMGYVVIAHNGWIVRKFKDGRIEQIEKLEVSNAPLNFD